MRKTGLNRRGLSATTAAVAGSISAPANGTSACKLIETEVANCEGFDFTRLALPAFTQLVVLVERLECRIALADSRDPIGARGEAV
jgi:hypothetical protein